MKSLIRAKIIRPFAKRYLRPRGKTDDRYQERLLHYFIVQNTKTLRGKKYGFSKIKTIKDYQKQVPLSTYDDLQPYIESMLQGAKDILRYGKVPFFSKSSGTTAVSKYIPITHEALKKNHYAVSKLGLGSYLHEHGDSLLFGGECLAMGGRLVSNPFSPTDMNVGDVSAILQYNAPWYTRTLRKPSPAVSFMENFDQKLDAIIEETKDLDITSLAGVPSWLTLFLQRLLEKTGKKNVLEVWPHLELFFRGGINIAPYKHQLHTMIPGMQVSYRQNYNASEGFFAVQDKLGVDDMLLATHHHIFYEFIPFEESANPNPTAYLLHDLQIGKRYEIVITTDGGLRRYRLGDVVEITGVNPVRIRVAGRTKSFLNAFGEEVMVHTTDDAIHFACETYKLPRAEYVVTPVMQDAGGYHHWYIDFGQDVDMDIAILADILDTFLQDHNSDYKAKRAGNILMQKLQITILKPKTFHAYMESKKKLGGQHKLKKLWNERDDLMKEMGEWLIEWTR